MASGVLRTHDTTARWSWVLVTAFAVAATRWQCAAAISAGTAEPLVFFLGGNGIYSLPLSQPSANATLVYKAPNYKSMPVSLAVGDEYLYWSINSGCGIYQCRFDGGEVGMYVNTNHTKYGNGNFIYPITFYEGILYYQTMANWSLFEVYAIDVNTAGPSVVSIGNFGCTGASNHCAMNGGLSAMRGATGPTMLFWGVYEDGTPAHIMSAPAVAGASATIINKNTLNFPQFVTALSNLSGVVFTGQGGHNDVFRISATGGSATTIPGPPNCTGLVISGFAVIPNTTKLMVALTLTGRVTNSSSPAGIYTLDLSTGTWELFHALQVGTYLASVRVGGFRMTGLTVTEVSPSSGPQDANTTVFVVGTGFKQSPSLACLFGGTMLVHAAFQTSEVVKCVAPPSPVAGKAEVQVTNDGGDFSTQPVYFTYTPAGGAS